MKAVASKPPNAAPSEVPAFSRTPAAFGVQGFFRPGCGGSFQPSQVVCARFPFGGGVLIAALTRQGLRVARPGNAGRAFRDGKD